MLLCHQRANTLTCDNSNEFRVKEIDWDNKTTFVHYPQLRFLE